MNQLAVSLARIADCVGTLLNSPIIIAAVALIGVILTARSSRKVAFSQNLHERLSSYYAEVFSTYIAIFNLTDKNRRSIQADFVSACEKTMTLCSDNSRDILRKLESQFIKDEIEPERCGELLSQLRETSRADLEAIIPRTPWYKRFFHFLSKQFKTDADNQNDN